MPILSLWQRNMNSSLKMHIIYRLRFVYYYLCFMEETVLGMFGEQISNVNYTYVRIRSILVYAGNVYAVVIS